MANVLCLQVSLKCIVIAACQVLRALQCSMYNHEYCKLAHYLSLVQHFQGVLAIMQESHLTSSA